MSYLSALAEALPAGPDRAPGGPDAVFLTAAVSVSALLWVTLLCWWTRPVRLSAQRLAGAGFLVIERSPLVTRFALSDQEQLGTTRLTPGSDEEKPPMFWSKLTLLLQAERETLRQAGFTPTQIDRFLRIRAAYRAGYYHPDPSTPARLHFARWLSQHGKISG